MVAAGVTASNKLLKRRMAVRSSWHEQVAKSTVTALVLSADGTTLFVGCDTAAPQPEEQGSKDACLFSVSLQDGKTNKQFRHAEPLALRMLDLHEKETQVWGVDGNRRITIWNTQDVTIQTQVACPAAPSSADLASPAIKLDHVASSTVIETAEAGPSPSTAGGSVAGQADAGPEFLAELGYRGPMKGYLFRNGSRGVGYYSHTLLFHAHTVPHDQPWHPQPASSPDSSTAPTGEPNFSSQHKKSTPLGAAHNAVNRTAEEFAAAEAALATPHAGSNPKPATPARAPTTQTVRQGSYLQRLLAAPPTVPSLTFSCDRSRLYAASLGPADNDITVWDAATGELITMLKGHEAPVLAVCLSPDGGTLVSGSYDRTIRLWRAAGGEAVRVLRGHQGGVRCLAPSPDGRRLYSCASDNTIRVWDLDKGICLRSMHGRHEPHSWPCCIALSADGEFLATASDAMWCGGSTIKVFETHGLNQKDAGNCLATFAQLGFHDKGAVSALQFSHDGTVLFSGASDGTVAAWKLSVEVYTPHQNGIRAGFL